MRNKVFGVNGKRKIIRAGQFCNGPLQNCYFDINREVGWQ